MTVVLILTSCLETTHCGLTEEGLGMLKKALFDEKQGRDGDHLLGVLQRKWKGASGIRQLICCIKRFQRLRLYARCFLIVALASIVLILYYFCPLPFSAGEWIARQHFGNGC